jgi:hypothetical protein
MVWPGVERIVKRNFPKKVEKGVFAAGGRLDLANLKLDLQTTEESSDYLEGAWRAGWGCCEPLFGDQEETGAVNWCGYQTPHLFAMFMTMAMMDGM